MFNISQKILKLEGYGKDIENLVEREAKLEKYVLDALDKLKTDQELFKRQVNETVEKHNMRL